MSPSRKRAPSSTPMKVQIAESALREEMKNAILLLAREIDALKAR